MKNEQREMNNEEAKTFRAFAIFHFPLFIFHSFFRAPAFVKTQGGDCLSLARYAQA
jgi:hypothetical protein